MMRFMILVALAITASPGAIAAQNTEQAADDQARSLPIAALTCRDLLQASGQKRDLLLALMHGYVAGKKGLQSVDTVDMSFVTDMVVDHCIDAPSDRLLAAFAANEKRGP